MENGNVTGMAERLTFDGNFCEIARCKETRWGKYCPDGACSQRKVWERLKQYEDSDAIPVVRCKDCKHWLKDVPGCTDFVGRCELANYMVGATGYCVYGERRADDE